MRHRCLVHRAGLEAVRDSGSRPSLGTSATEWGRAPVYILLAVAMGEGTAAVSCAGAVKRKGSQPREARQDWQKR